MSPDADDERQDGPPEPVATVTSLYRYPVKSMQGFAVDELRLRPDGIEGDRRWAVLDRDSGALLSAKRYPELLQVRALDDHVALPDGSTVALDSPDADDHLSRLVGFEVHLEERRPDIEVAYEMAVDPEDDESDLAKVPSPRGTFLDFAGAHLLSEATLTDCAVSAPDIDWDVRRFRPNIVGDGPAPFAEDRWCPGTVHCGEASMTAQFPTPRCAMPLRAQSGLEAQPGLAAALKERRRAYSLGIYLDIVEGGTVRVGDVVLVAGGRGPRRAGSGEPV